MNTKHVRIVGTGLIGTSIALALAKTDLTLELADEDPNALALARDLLKDRIKEARPDLVVVATPPMATLLELEKEYQTNPQAIFIDVGSTKNNLQLKVDALSDLRGSFVGTHPMAGREVSGASSAQADLFEGRAWIITPGRFSDQALVNEVQEFVELLGATAYRLTPQVHDEVMAQISHLPQILSSVLASSLNSLETGSELAGQGLRDMTRIAGSDPKLWTQIFLDNQEAVLGSLREFEEQFARFKSALPRADSDALTLLMREGSSGREKVSGKHGAKPRNYSHLLVVIKDEPGALSRLFNECAEIHANIEDLAIEHSPGQYTGLITLAFSPEDAKRVASHLVKKNWTVHQK